MPELSTETLPLLPLTSGVVLPGMVVTATLETPESRAAASSADDAGGLLLLVPKVDGRYARVGTVAKIENAGELPNGQLAVVVRGLARARIGAGVAGTGSATWVEVEQLDDPPATEESMRLAREYRAVVESILEARGAQQVAERSARPGSHGRASPHSAKVATSVTAAAASRSSSSRAAPGDPAVRTRWSAPNRRPRSAARASSTLGRSSTRNRIGWLMATMVTETAPARFRGGSPGKGAASERVGSWEVRA